jgi:hypothetical protein
MLATRVEDPRRLADSRATAPSPSSTASAPYSTSASTAPSTPSAGAARSLSGFPGLAWLREIGWPVARAVLDGEAVAGDGSEGIQAVFEARTRPGNPMAFAAFDLLALDGQSVMAEPWDGPANI